MTSLDSSNTIYLLLRFKEFKKDWHETDPNMNKSTLGIVEESSGGIRLLARLKSPLHSLAEYKFRRNCNTVITNKVTLFCEGHHEPPVVSTVTVKQLPLLNKCRSYTEQLTLLRFGTPSVFYIFETIKTYQFL